MTVSVVLLTVSCADLLNEDIRTQVGDNRFNTPAGFEEVLNAAYLQLRQYYGQERSHGMTEAYGVDIWHEGADGSHKQWNFYGVQLNAATDWAREMWDEMYRGINIANTVINRAEDQEEVSEEVKRVRVGEARFLRAHFYFVLVQQYGAVHISTEETQGVEIEASRAPVDAVFELIIEDLEHAIANLPDEQEDYGRATKPASEHLLARVLLTRASEFYRDEAGAAPDDYERAAQLAERVINEYNFRLLEDVADVWAVGNERNEEVVWAAQNSRDRMLNEIGNKSHLYYLTVYDEMPAMSRTIEYGRPWRRYRPTEYMYDYLLGPETRDIDSRYDAFFQDIFYATVSGTFTVNGVEGVEIAEGDTAIYFPGEEWSLEEKLAAPYTVVLPSDYNPRDFLSLTKHRAPERHELNEEEGWRDFLAFRLAETHLIAAEAHLENGNETAALDHLNTVRRRAAWPGQEEAMELDSVDLEAILEERARELMGEQHRWYDLKRWGLLVERAYEHNPEVQRDGLMQEYHNLRPIPQTQIDRTAGGESAFPQNPGY